MISSLLRSGIAASDKRDTDPKLLLLILALAIVVLAVLKAFFPYVNQYGSPASAPDGADVRERVFAHLQRLSLSFSRIGPLGNLAYLLTSDEGGKAS